MADWWTGAETIAELIARLRAEQGKSQYALADALSNAARRADGAPDRGMVYRWETGRRIPTPYWRTHLASVLGVPVETLDRAAATAKARRATQQADSPADDKEIPGTPTRILEMWDELMRRRDFLYQSGAAALLTAGPSYPTTRGSRPAAEAVMAYAELTASYRRAEGLLGPGAVYTQVAEHQRRLTEWLPQVRGDQTAWRQLAQVTADASVLLAWLSFDLDSPAQAMGLYRQSYELAREMGDVNLAAFLVGRMSRTLSESGRHRYALEFAGAAQRMAGDSAVPQLRSWLAATRAYVHACLGDESSCREALDTASALAGQQTGAPPPYLAFYGEPYLNKWRGHALLALAEHKAAQAASSEGRAAIDHALAAWSDGDVRESGEVLVAAARARVAQREVEEAARLAASAHDVASATGSPRIMRYVTGISRELRPWLSTKAVAELGDRLPPGG